MKSAAHRRRPRTSRATLGSTPLPADGRTARAVPPCPLTHLSTTRYTRAERVPPLGGVPMPIRRLVPLVLMVWVLVSFPGLDLANAAPRFTSEQAVGTPFKHQSNWEPTVATDPGRPNLVYQLITGINAHECAPGCPGTSVLFRASVDGGATWGPERFVCGLACKGVGWQFDPEIKVELP